MGEEGRKGFKDEVGGLCGLIRRGIGSSCDHEVILHCPPSGRQGNWVGSISELSIEVDNDLLGRSMDCQGNIATRGGGAESHNQRGLHRSLRH